MSKNLPATQSANVPAVPSFESMMQLAEVLAGASIVPEVYRKNPSNCFIAIEMAARMRVPPMTFMQKSYILNGKPSVEAQLIIAALNTSGLIDGSINYKFEGEGMGRVCTASAAIAGTGEVKSYRLRLADAIKVGNAPKNPNWQSVPDLMLSYRSATYLIRSYFPEVALGMTTVEELQDMGDMVDVTPKAPPPAEAQPAALTRVNEPEIRAAAEAVVRQPEAEVLPPQKSAKAAAQSFEFKE